MSALRKADLQTLQEHPTSEFPDCRLPSPPASPDMARPIGNIHPSLNRHSPAHTQRTAGRYHADAENDCMSDPLGEKHRAIRTEPLNRMRKPSGKDPKISFTHVPDKHRPIMVMKLQVDAFLDLKLILSLLLVAGAVLGDSHMRLHWLITAIFALIAWLYVSHNPYQKNTPVRRWFFGCK
jgi:hypothetical protein